MKLDHNCLRAVLITVEDFCTLAANEVDIYCFKCATLEDLCTELPKYEKEDVLYSVLMLHQAGYIDANILNCDLGVMDAVVYDLTFEGHEFLEQIRDNGRWKAVTKAAGKVGDFSLQMLRSIAKGLGSALLNKISLVDYLPVISE